MLQVVKLSQNQTGCVGANALDGGQQIALLLKVRMPGDMLLNLLFHLINVLGEKGNLFFQVIHNGGGRMSCMFDRAQAIALALLMRDATGWTQPFFELESFRITVDHTADGSFT